MTNFLVLLSRVSLGNYGLAIILFTLLMRAITWPITQRQILASRAMQTAQPKIQQIQKQYKDPKRRQEEIMKVYREVGFSPAGCIWPMLIQMPIWFALYQSIRFTVSGTPESLLNLSQELYPWSFLRTALPLDRHFLWMDMGRPDPTLLMAVLVGGSTWVQYRMTTPMSPTADPQQQQVNQTMQLMMPLMFAFFTLQFPSGLALYWFSTNLVSIVLQYFYLGRRVSWRQMLSITPAPAPAVKRQDREEKPAAEEAKEPEEVAAGTERRRRKRRRGRRRR
jgi:YidC/Oxa1 family membrane protein insertase